MQTNKTKLIVINDGGNDLKIEVTKMPAMQAYDFVVRAVLAATGSGIDEGLLQIQSEGSNVVMALLKTLGKMPYDQAKPLLDELLACCARVDGNMKEICSQATMDGYIIDFRTIFKLQFEAAKMNFDFLAAGGDES